MLIVKNIDNTTYTNITKGRTDKNNVAWIPDVIVCHITEGSYEGACSWLKNPAAQASAHFVVSRKGEITQLVDIRDTAWANGTSYTPSSTEKSTSSIVKSRNTNANCYTVSIEHEGLYMSVKGALTTEQESATIFLIKYIDSEIKRIYGQSYGIKFDREHIIGHNEISPNSKPHCPGEKYPFSSIISNLNRKEDVEMVTETEIQIDGKKYKVNRILKDGRNYIELRSFEQAGYKVGYKQDEKLPTFDK